MDLFDCEKETPHFNILKPQVASDALTSELDDAQDESESDTFLDTLRKFLLLCRCFFRGILRLRDLFCY